MAGKTPDRTRKSVSQKKTPAQQGSTVTPINRGDLAQGGNGARTNKTETKPTEPVIAELIRQRAYELFEQRGRVEGFDQEDWARAEEEILARFRRGKSA